MVGFIVIPLFLVIYYGLTNKEGAFTLENILAMGEIEHIKALGLSVALSFVSTLICLVIAYPLAMFLRSKHMGKGSFVAPNSRMADSFGEKRCDQWSFKVNGTS